MSIIGSPRRYYLAKRHVACADPDSDLGTVWQAKQEAEPGTLLPVDFPHLETINPLGYTTSEDLDGATVQELVDLGVAKPDAQDVMTAHAAL